MPGVYFQAETPAREGALPRMDVACFVGFASSGPLNIPVAIEDEVRFVEIFGGDLTIGVDHASGKIHKAFLGPTVRSFFLNGGRRCWVVRVAEKDMISNLFHLPGIMGVQSEVPLEYGSAMVKARSEGHWSDNLGVSTVLLNTPVSMVTLTPGAEGKVSLKVEEPEGEYIERGDLLRFVFSETETVLYFAVSDVKNSKGDRGDAFKSLVDIAGKGFWFETERETTSPPSVPPQREITVFSVKRQLCPIEAEKGIKNAKGNIIGDRLSFEICVSDGKRGISRITNLGFCKNHPRFWGNLPTDEMLYTSPEEGWLFQDGPLPGESSLWKDAGEPRFPVAAPEEVEDVYLPFGMEILRGGNFVSGAFKATEQTPGEKGHLDIISDIFLDEHLKDEGAGTLLATAFHKRHTRSKRLEKIHSILPVEEVSLISVPDASYTGWKSVAVKKEELLSAPELIINNGYEYEVSWNEINRATIYRLQESWDPRFSSSVTDYEISENKMSFARKDICAKAYYYRVRAEADGKTSPWSNTCSTIMTARDFKECIVASEVPPVLSVELINSPPEAKFNIIWECRDNDTCYLLQRSVDPDFRAPVTVYKGIETSPDILLLKDRIYYYRVCIDKDGMSGPWSNTMVVEPPNDEVWRLKRPDDNNRSDILEIHKALLRMSIARGDLFAILTLPDNFRESDVITYKRSLVAGLAGGEEKALSYGALYHPWIYNKTTVSDIQVTPPDGVITGSIAVVSVNKGAWIAPANENILGVSGLQPTIVEKGRQALYLEHVNVLGKEPQGFMFMSEKTLSTDKTLRPINVRRLLILLRKIVAREGQSMVFEPNNDAFRRLVERKFEGILSGLYVRGAFSGDTPETSYRIITDNSANTRESMDSGRFIVELRVAPSTPMAFITVRLIQSGSGSPVIAEV